MLLANTSACIQKFVELSGRQEFNHKSTIPITEQETYTVGITGLGPFFQDTTWQQCCKKGVLNGEYSKMSFSSKDMFSHVLTYASPSKDLQALPHRINHRAKAFERKWHKNCNMEIMQCCKGSERMFQSSHLTEFRKSNSKEAKWFIKEYTVAHF